MNDESPNTIHDMTIAEIETAIKVVSAIAPQLVLESATTLTGHAERDTFLWNSARASVVGTLAEHVQARETREKKRERERGNDHA